MKTKNNDAKLLLETRTSLGMTQQQVADKSHVPLERYQKFESGERSLMSTNLWTCGQILKSLGLDITTYV